MLRLYYCRVYFSLPLPGRNPCCFICLLPCACSQRAYGHTRVRWHSPKIQPICVSIHQCPRHNLNIPDYLEVFAYHAGDLSLHLLLIITSYDSHRRPPYIGSNTDEGYDRGNPLWLKSLQNGAAPQPIMCRNDIIGFERVYLCTRAIGVSIEIHP